MTTAIPEHVARFVAMKQRLGYRFTTNASTLWNFARFAAERNEAFIRSGTVLEWASAAPSQPRSAKKLQTVCAFARWLHAEDERHEVPPRDALGPASFQRPAPHLISIQDIQKLLTAALSMPPAGTIAPLTWHYLFGLVAATGLRIGEARALTFEDITPDGLIVRDTKFGKSRMVALDPTTRTALNRYLVARCKEKTQDEHLFVLGTGRPPGKTRVSAVFLELAEQTGIREPGATRGPSSHSLRHSFAVRSLERESVSPARHAGRRHTRCGTPSPSGPLRTWNPAPTPAVTCWRSPPTSAMSMSREPTGTWTQPRSCCAASPRQRNRYT